MSAFWSNVYWVLLGGTILIACGATLLAAWQRLPPRWGMVWLALALVALFIAGRWPSIFIPGLLNPDESMMIAQAMKFAISPIPWRSIDTQTGGPINAYALLPLHWFGVDYGFPLARMTAIACLVAYLILTLAAMRRIAGPAAAAIAVLPAAGFHALVTRNEFIHYSSEVASLTMIALTTFLAARLSPQPTSRSADNWSAGAVGVGLFLVSMSKLQGAPLGLVLTFCMLVMVSPSPGIFLRRALFAAAGGAAAMMLLVCVLAASGGLYDFYMAYIRLPYTYLIEPLGSRRTFAWMQVNDGAREFVDVAAWMIGASMLLVPFHWQVRRNAPQIAMRAVSALLIAGALYITLSQPGREFAHYKNYLSLGLSWVLLMLLPWRVPDVVDGAASDAPMRPRVAQAVLGIASVSALVVLFAGRLESNWLIEPQIPYGDANKHHWLYHVLGAVSKPGQPLGIWGWAAHIWVYSGLIPATRESSTEYAARNWGPEGYYRDRFLGALKKDPPPLFVEAVGRGQFAFVDRERNGVGSVPGLLPFLRHDYTRVLDDNDTGLWMRNDALANCCQYSGTSIHARTKDSTLFWPESAQSAIPKEQEWIISDSNAAGSTARLTFAEVDAGMQTAFVPLMVGPSADRAGLRIEYNGATNDDCTRRIRSASPLTIEICQIDLKQGGRIELIDDDPQPGAWIAVGAPLLTRNSAAPAS